MFVDNSENGHPTLDKGTQQQLKTHKLNQSIPTANTSNSHLTFKDISKSFFSCDIFILNLID